MPPSFASKYGPWAIVAGASQGLGAAFASALASRGVHLLLLARRAELLEDVAQELRATFHVEVRTQACDLARPDLPAALEAMSAGLDIGLGIYNAAYAPIGEFAARPLEDLMRVVDVNVRGPLVFARTLAPAMIARGSGGLVLMSSLAGLQGGARIAAYAASKSFNTVLGEGLWSELRPHGVDVVVACAGGIRTPAYAAASSREAPGTLDADAIAEATLAALGRGPVVVPGAVNKVARFVLSRMLSRRAAVATFARSTKELS